MALYSLKRRYSSSSASILNVEPVGVFRGASIAHRKLGPDEAAAHAASWLDGTIFVEPTIDLACATLKTNYPAVIAARGRRGNRPTTESWLRLTARGWLELSEPERAAFAACFEPSIWQALEGADNLRRID
jgi:hypothetical protein